MSDESRPNQPPSRPNFPQMEEEIAAFWKKERIFERSIEEKSENKSYVFYDGPPFATGMPHYGHLLQSAIKDAIPRYFTMNGYRVPRRWGWDCHGLPIENLIEKQLGLKTKHEIVEYGIDKFNEACRSVVLQYASDWKRYVERLGRWVDFDGAYIAMDETFIESVWWVFGELWKKKLVYDDVRVSLYCPRCATPLSAFEIAMNNSYVDMQDPAVTVKFKVKGEEKTYFLAWTTTPWTLPANVALAVHPDQIYARVRILETGETLIFADSLLSSVLRQYLPLNDEPKYEVLSKIKGSELEGMEYEPLYPLGEAGKKMVERQGENWYKVVSMGYVTATDGTGIVHTAPAFGEDDFMASKAHGLPVVVTIDEEGRQRPEVGMFVGVGAKDSNPLVIEDLKARGLLYREEKITHSVAECWRCATPLLYKAQPAWFLNVTKLKPKLLETAKKVNWHPEHFKEGRFGKGLETAPDWCLSRTRFWGAPIPVWKCEKCSDMKVFSSVKEIEEATGKKFPKLPERGLDLHRPAIDEMTLACACGGKMTRVPEVFDVWFDSGSMPYASGHYPFENREKFEKNFPADFIGEGQDQTRGWFYVLHVLATALFGKPAFSHVTVTGLIMAEDGKKMSKSLKNYPDPWELMTRVGADALRVYLLSSPVVHAEQLNFSEKDVEVVQRTMFGTLWNVRAFYLMYAGETQTEIVKPRSMHVLDRWLMARLMSVAAEMTKAMDSYDLVAALRPLRGWLDDLSTWWLRRSRERMKSADSYDRTDALRTLREALLETSALLAPFAPFFAEKLYQDLGGAKMSVHLDRWPKVEERVIDEQLLKDMEVIRALAKATHEARATAKLPVRQALAKLTVHFRDAAEALRLSQRTELLAVLRDEVNVEQVVLVNGDTGEEAWKAELDTVITPELRKKGLARELSRYVMNLRKESGLAPADVIVLSVATADQGMRDLLEGLVAAITADVKATSSQIGADLPGEVEAKTDIELDGQAVKVGIRKV